MMNLAVWQVWLIFGLLVMMVEMVLPTFAALWLGAAALLVALLAWLLPGLGVTAQVLLWLGLSVVLLVLWFKKIRPLARNRTLAGLGREQLIGQVGTVVATPVEGRHGTVRFSVPVMGSDEWLCRSTHALALGDRVQVTQIFGNELLVEPLHPAP
jgi:membrane protein implicated in regulation of membrane protease activity